MTVIPTATFLAGALLTLLVPIVLLIALVVWYLVVFRRVPEPVDGGQPSEAAAPVAPEAGGPPSREP